MSSKLALGAVRIDKVRASREGHTYHDTWTARVALELLTPTTTLIAIAVEGLSTEDAQIASVAATEIADLVRYRGGVGIAQASHVEVVQFKYSIAEASVPMRATDVRKTLAKFAKADTDFAAVVGAERGREVVRYELVTNRPCASRIPNSLAESRIEATLRRGGKGTLVVVLLVHVEACRAMVLTQVGRDGAGHAADPWADETADAGRPIPSGCRPAPGPRGRAFGVLGV